MYRATNASNLTKILIELPKCVQNAIGVSRGAKTVAEYHIHWKRPAKLPCIHPEKCGDKGIDIGISHTDLGIQYKDSKELDGASDLVKRAFTIEFLGSEDLKKARKEKFIDLVKRHQLDRHSPECQIAAMTSEIYGIQEYLENNPRNRRAKVSLKELIDKRKKYLTSLRRADYRRFEWLLEKLNLVYYPHPEAPASVTRKGSIRMLTTSYCEKIVQSKLDDYKRDLREQAKLFFKEKVDKLEFIRSEQLKLGLAVTISDEQIAEARRKSDEIEL